MSSRPILEWRQWWRDRAACSPLAAVAAKQGYVLATAELAAHGVTRAQARWAIGQDAWLRPVYGVIAPIDIRDELPESSQDWALRRRRSALVTTGIALRRPDETPIGRSSAVLHGLPLLALPQLPELSSIAPGSLGRRSTAHLKGGILDAWQCEQWHGVRIADVARTLVDLGRMDARDAIIAVDAALREGVVSVDELERALDLAWRWPGTRRAREVLSLADPRSESPLESLVRLTLHDDGFPPPEPQVWIDRDRVDFFWPAYGLVLEADGRVKYTSEERWQEKLREQRLRRHVRRVERVTWTDVTKDWPITRVMLRSAMS